MIVHPFEMTSMVIALSFNALAVICYSILLVKIKGITYNDLFVELAWMLMVSLVF